jgi:hypothetical protein
VGGGKGDKGKKGRLKEHLGNGKVSREGRKRDEENRITHRHRGREWE